MTEPGSEATQERMAAYPMLDLAAALPSGTACYGLFDGRETADTTAQRLFRDAEENGQAISAPTAYELSAETSAALALQHPVFLTHPIGYYQGMDSLDATILPERSLVVLHSLSWHGGGPEGPGDLWILDEARGTVSTFRAFDYAFMPDGTRLVFLRSEVVADYDEDQERVVVLPGVELPDGIGLGDGFHDRGERVILSHVVVLDLATGEGQNYPTAVGELLALDGETVLTTAWTECYDDEEEELLPVEGIRRLDLATGSVMPVEDLNGLECERAFWGEQVGGGSEVSIELPEEFEPGSLLWNTPSGRLGLVGATEESFQIARLPPGMPLQGITQVRVFETRPAGDVLVDEYDMLACMH